MGNETRKKTNWTELIKLIDKLSADEDYPGNDIKAAMEALRQLGFFLCQ